MNCTFRLMGLKRSIATDASALTLSDISGRRRIAWEEIEGAGPLKLGPIQLPENFPKPLVPGTGAVNKALAGHSSIWVAYRKGRRLRLAYFQVPRENLGELAAELRNRIGAHWSDEARNALKVREQFGISNWWVPLAALGLMPVVGVLLFAYWGVLGTVWRLVQGITQRYWYLVLLVLFAWYAYGKLRSLRGPTDGPAPP